MKNVKPISSASPSALKAFVLASRPKTWIAAISPVLLGAALSYKVNPLVFTLTLLFSLLIQIGTNYANDYFDFINGADTHLRNGPKRATQEGWIEPKVMLFATFATFSLALTVAIPLMITAGLWSLFLALLCIAFGILYTGGPKPLGYLGLGEILVLIFFGPVATCGTYFLQMHTLDMPVFIASFIPGFFSCALLAVNNLRDEMSDVVANKMTLVARFGKAFGRLEYVMCLVFAQSIPLILSFCYGLSLHLLWTLVTIPIATLAIKKVRSFRDPLELISVLGTTALLFVLHTTIFAIALW